MKLNKYIDHTLKQDDENKLIVCCPRLESMTRQCALTDLLNMPCYQRCQGSHIVGSGMTTQWCFETKEANQNGADD